MRLSLRLSAYERHEGYSYRELKSFSSIMAETCGERGLLVKISKGTLKDGETVKVKLSGDGAHMSRMTNFILLSFTILQKVDDILSSKGNHTIAVINGCESRQTLEESFRDVFLGANKIIDDGFIEIDGKKVGVDIYLGGDHMS